MHLEYRNELATIVIVQKFVQLAYITGQNRIYRHGKVLAIPVNRTPPEM